MKQMVPVCPRCSIELTIGIGINPTTPDRLKHALIDPSPGYINHNNLKLDTVWKCSKCGHSQDIVLMR